MTKTELRLLWLEVVLARNKLLKKKTRTNKASKEYQVKYHNFLDVSGWRSGGRYENNFKEGEDPHQSWSDLRMPDGTIYKWNEPL